MQYQVQVIEVGSQLLAAARGQGNAQNYVTRLFELLDEVWTFLKANPQVKHEGLNVFVYFGEDEGNKTIEAGVKVPVPFESAGKVTCSDLPAGTVATVAHFGPYEKLAEAHFALRDWCKENKRQQAGPAWEIYDHWNDNPDKLRTDIFYLLK